MQLISILINLFLVYLGMGLVFAIAFIIKGVQRVDAGAEGTSWGFRLLLLPGAMAFWPILLQKWIKRRWKNQSKPLES
jgi:hypothetical protein